MKNVISFWLSDTFCWPSSSALLLPLYSYPGITPTHSISLPPLTSSLSPLLVPLLVPWPELKSRIWSPAHSSLCALVSQGLGILADKAS